MVEIPPWLKRPQSNPETPFAQPDDKRGGSTAESIRGLSREQTQQQIARIKNMPSLEQAIMETRLQKLEQHLASIAEPDSINVAENDELPSVDEEATALQVEFEDLGDQLHWGQAAQKAYERDALQAHAHLKSRQKLLQQQIKTLNTEGGNGEQLQKIKASTDEINALAKQIEAAVSRSEAESAEQAAAHAAEVNPNKRDAQKEDQWVVTEKQINEAEQAAEFKAANRKEAASEAAQTIESLEQRYGADYLQQFPEYTNAKNQFEKLSSLQTGKGWGEDAKLASHLIATAERNATSTLARLQAAIKERPPTQVTGEIKVEATTVEPETVPTNPQTEDIDTEGLAEYAMHQQSSIDSPAPEDSSAYTPEEAAALAVAVDGEPEPSPELPTTSSGWKETSELRNEYHHRKDIFHNLRKQYLVTPENKDDAAFMEAYKNAETAFREAKIARAKNVLALKQSTVTQEKIRNTITVQSALERAEVNELADAEISANKQTIWKTLKERMGTVLERNKTAVTVVVGALTILALPKKLIAQGSGSAAQAIGFDGAVVSSVVLKALAPAALGAWVGRGAGSLVGKGLERRAERVLDSSISNVHQNLDLQNFSNLDELEDVLEADFNKLAQSERNTDTYKKVGTAAGIAAGLAYSFSDVDGLVGYDTGASNDLTESSTPESVPTVDESEGATPDQTESTEPLRPEPRPETATFEPTEPTEAEPTPETVDEPQPEATAEAIPSVDLETLVYSVQPGDQGVTYILQECYPDLFPPVGSPDWPPIYEAFKNNPELLAAANFPNADIDDIFPGDQYRAADTFRADVFAEYYLNNIADPSLREAYLASHPDFVTAVPEPSAGGAAETESATPQAPTERLRPEPRPEIEPSLPVEEIQSPRQGIDEPDYDLNPMEGTLVNDVPESRDVQLDENGVDAGPYDVNVPEMSKMVTETVVEQYIHNSDGFEHILGLRDDEVINQLSTELNTWAESEGITNEAALTVRAEQFLVREIIGQMFNDTTFPEGLQNRLEVLWDIPLNALSTTNLNDTINPLMTGLQQSYAAESPVAFTGTVGEFFTQQVRSIFDGGRLSDAAREALSIRDN